MAKMHQMDFSPALLANLSRQTVLITGSAQGIGAATASLFNSHGANVVLVDLPSAKSSAETLIESFEDLENAVFVPADIRSWSSLVNAFKLTVERFGRVDILVANAAIMESIPVLDIEVDAQGNPIECAEAIRVLDVNMKGSLNTLRLGLHYLSKNQLPATGFRGSMVFVTSTSGYFGSTGNAAYISSKHGVVGLVRASLGKAASLGIKISAIAPCFTPTHITAGFGDKVKDAGLEANTLEGVASAVASSAADPNTHGTACLVWGEYRRELEFTLQNGLETWLGADLVESLSGLKKLMDSIGGYPLPQHERVV